MPIWGITDAVKDKPKFPKERQARFLTTLTTANNTVSGNTTVQFTITGGSIPLANAGIILGMYAYDSNTANSLISTSGKKDYFFANNTVLAISGNMGSLYLSAT